MKTRYSYTETENGYHIVREGDDPGTIATVSEKRSAELIVSELNSTSVPKVDDLDLYEIHVYNDKPITEGIYEGVGIGEMSQWDTVWVLTTDEHIFDYPFFDSIISKNDGDRNRGILFPS